MEVSSPWIVIMASQKRSSRFLQRILYPISNLPFHPLHLFLLLELIEKFDVEESLLVKIPQ